MSQTATFFVIDKKGLEFLQKESQAEGANKKNWLGLLKKTPDTLLKKLESITLEKINYRWSGLAFAIVAVFSKEKLHVDWDALEYSDFANELSSKTELGIYIFSINDQDLLKLKPTGLFYSEQELDQFAVDFEGKKPANPDIMKNAIKILDEALSKLTKEKLVLLLIK
ncbi:MAG: hypothetical protein H7122_05375 [Chitinophagaceae bacterium]|nr:hypothetical protein [Chitinophagaceae bacterium]